MATNITAAQVQATGGWSILEAPDATLALAPYIPFGDAWLNKILIANGTTFATITGDALAMAVGAECFYVAALFVMRPPKATFESGPIKETDIKADERAKIAAGFMKQAKEALSQAGYFVENWAAISRGGDDYHPNGADDSNIDFALGLTDSDYPYNPLGYEI